VNFASGGSGTQIADRFVPVHGVAPRRLPAGIQIAAPAYGGLANAACDNCDFFSNDSVWLTLSHLPNINSSWQGERPGCLIAVMYAPNGTTIAHNAKSDSNRTWVDFNNDHRQQWKGLEVDYSTPQTISECAGAPSHIDMFSQYADADEPFVIMAPFLALFDDDEARRVQDVSRWNMLITPGGVSMCNRIADYTEYITNNADRIHFNRYTGVAMR
jgi:hypothetical protein